MKLKDFFTSCSTSNGKKVKAVKQKYSNLGPNQRPLKSSKSHPNLEWKTHHQHPLNGERRINTLKVGDRVVWVRETRGYTTQESGTVRWLGQIENEEIAGIEFDRNLGLGSGWYKRKQLFSCPLDHGGLVAVAGLILEEDLDIYPRIPPPPPGPSSTGSTSSATSSASSSLNKDPRRNSSGSSSGAKRRSYEHLDLIDPKRNTYERELQLEHERNSPASRYLKSESSSPSWSSGSSGGDPALQSQLVSIVPSYQDYSQGKLRWQGKGEVQEDWEKSYSSDKTVTTSYSQLRSDRVTPEVCPRHYQQHNRLYGELGSGEFLGRVIQETDLDASSPLPSYQEVSVVMPSFPYIHPPIREEDIERICGRLKGIQGHCNSCYLDATLFAMFSFTSVFDSILLFDAGKNNRVVDLELAKETQRILREDIVNPLRKDFLTPAANVMELRLKMKDFDKKMTSEEMDPEEFLHILFRDILRLDEFVSWSSGNSDYFHQVWCDENQNEDHIPSVQQLFEQSLQLQKMKLRGIPRPALILQMPRSGNKYKTYKGILPNLTIDVTDLMDDTPRECVICGELATHECKDCYGQFSSPSETHSGADSTSFCAACVAPVHSKPERSTHKNILPIKYSFPTDSYFLSNLSQPNPTRTYNNNLFLNGHTNGHGIHFPSNLASASRVQCYGGGSSKRIPRITMDLFAVICIETSHFVSFVKCGVDQYAPWVFFDSMADRCETVSGKGHNIPQVKMLPKMGQWLSQLETLPQEEIREMMGTAAPELKRLLNDPYICIYYSPQSSMYI
jgi:ubiquitin thioesterase CYLD